MTQPVIIETSAGTVAIFDHGVCFIRTSRVPQDIWDKLATEETARAASMVTYISKDELDVVVTMGNERLDVLIAPADIEKVIKLSAASSEQQVQIVEAVQSMLGHTGVRTEKQAGLFLKSGMLIIWAVAAAIITPLAYFIASESGTDVHDASDVSGSHRSEKLALLWLSKFLGPVGTLVIGAAITLWLIRKVIKNSRNDFAIRTYKFS